MNLPVFFVRLSKLSLLTDALSVHRCSLCSSKLSLFIDDFRLRILFHKKGDFLHQTVCQCTMRHDCCNADDNNLMFVLLINLSRRDMEYLGKSVFFLLL